MKRRHGFRGGGPALRALLFVIISWTVPDHGSARSPVVESAQDQRRGAAASDRGEDERVARNRRRWNALPPAARQRLRRLYRKLDPATRDEFLAQLRTLSTEERTALRQSKRQLRQMPNARRQAIRARQKALRRFFQALPVTEQERLRALPRPRFHREIRKLVESRLLERLDPEALAHFRSLPPGQKRKFLARELRHLDSPPRGRRQQLRRLFNALSKLPPRQQRFLIRWRPGDPIPPALEERVPPRLWSFLGGLSDRERWQLRRRLDPLQRAPTGDEGNPRRRRGNPPPR